MQESKEESNELKEKGKKRKIVIKPKTSVIISDDDLVETNREYLKEIFKENQLEELAKKYTIDKENREKTFIILSIRIAASSNNNSMKKRNHLLTMNC